MICIRCINPDMSGIRRNVGTGAQLRRINKFGRQKAPEWLKWCRELLWAAELRGQYWARMSKSGASKAGVMKS